VHIEKDRVSNLSIQDDFLPEEEFVALRDMIMSDVFPWFFQTTIVWGKEDGEIYEKEKETSPGRLAHVVYHHNVPESSFYESHIFPISKQLRIGLLVRIKINLSLRLPTPFKSEFHLDVGMLPEDIIAHYTTSIFYINTCNGYTEFKDGTKVESVANRLVSFPANIEHRGVTQTDEQGRYVINFNYLKRPEE